MVWDEGRTTDYGRVGATREAEETGGTVVARSFECT
jgi:hypothetical protein